MSILDQDLGFIGLGLMGKPMARNLARAGLRVVVHNRSQAVVQELAAEGLTPADSPAALARRVSTVVLMLSDTAAVERVLFGENGVVDALKPDAVVIDMGTTAVLPTRRFAAAVSEKGGHYVDAPVSGGQVGAVQASLSIMAGGAPQAYDRVLPVLKLLGKNITHVGAVGAGQVAKAANQIIVGLTIGAVAEALALVRKCDVDPAKVRAAFNGGFAWSRIMELHGQRMIDRDFAPGGKAATQRKDLQQALELAAAVGIDLPATELSRNLYDRLIAAGGGDLDHSALIKVIE